MKLPAPLLVVLLVHFLLLLHRSPAGVVYEPLSAFELGPAQPASGALLRHSDGNWYGVAAGGAYRFGTIYRVTPAGVVTTLLHFTSNGSTNRGADPRGGLASDGAGNFWGTTENGGLNSKGTIFKFNPASGALTTVVDFTGNGATHKGANPQGTLISDGAGNFWGTTVNGGTLSAGTVYKIGMANGNLTTVVNFNNPGGYYPHDGLVNDGAGNFWGTASEGGSGGYGTIYKVNMSSGVVTDVVHFSGSAGVNPGAYPFCALASDGAGNLWGTTSSTLTGNGTVFKVNLSSGLLSTLATFTGTGAKKGGTPYTGLASDGAGNFWGTTYFGGAANFGTLFKVNISSGTLTSVADFTGTAGANKGTNPQAPLVSDGTGNLWGTTPLGGSGDIGTVFKVQTSTGALTTVTQLADQCANSSAGLISDGAGNLWGTTVHGVSGASKGAIFKLDLQSRARTLVQEFTGTTGTNKGAVPTDLVSDGAGSFWGTTTSGGTSNRGTIFKVNASTGALTTLVHFTGTSGAFKGTSPQGALVRDGAGNFWGTTTAGGASLDGTIFKINTTSLAFSTVLEFTGSDPGNRGAYPQGALVSDGAGYFWGTTAHDNGVSGNGTIFKVNTSTGLLTTVLDFTGTTGANVGANPFAGLVQDGVGNFWGSTAAGGASGDGTIFKVGINSGVLTTVIEFTGTAGACKGSAPSAPLVGDGAGNFWGTTDLGGAPDCGTIFKISSTSGALTTLVEFTGSSGSAPGQNPKYGGLLLRPDGKFYGTTYGGGTAANGAPAGGGQIFRVSEDLATQAPVLASPAPAQNHGVTLGVDFTLPEAAAAGSVMLAFDHGTPATQVLTLASSQETAGHHAFTLSTGNLAAVPEVAAVTGGNALSDGLFSVTLSYQDAFGNPSATALAVNVRVDTTPPVFSLPGDLFVEATSSGGAVVSYAASASDSGSGLANSSFTPTSGTVFPLGATAVNALGADQVGNTATGSFIVTVRDTTPPALTILGDSPATIERTSTYTDAGATSADIVSGNVPVQTTGTVDTALSGNYPITYTARDAAGNVGTATRLVQVVDTIAPTISAVSLVSNHPTLPDQARFGEEVTLGFTASEAIQVPVVTMAGQAAAVQNVTGNQWIARIKVNVGTMEGAVAFTIASQDLAGNAAAVAKATTDGSSVTVDRVTFMPMLDTPSGSTVTKNPVSIAFRLPEGALAGSVKLAFRTYGTQNVVATLTMAASQESAGSHNFSFDPANPTGQPQIASGPAIPDGDYSLVLTYQDRVSNPAASSQNNNFLRIDTTKPVLTPVSMVAPAPASTWAKNGSIVTVTFNVNDHLTSATVRVGNQQVTATYEGSNNLWRATVAIDSSTPEGPLALAINATDMAGNVGDEVTATTDGTSVTVDRTPPAGTVPDEIVIFASPTGTAPLGDLRGQVSASDAGPVTIIQTPPPETVRPLGTSSVTFDLRDAIGNESHLETIAKVAFMRPSDADETTPVASSGADAPAGPPAGTKLGTFGPPALSDFRDLAVRATLAAGRKKLASIYVEDGAGSASLLAYEGGPVPDAAGLPLAGLVFQSFLDPVIAPGGAVAFAAKVQGARGAENQGVWTNVFGGATLQMALREGRAIAAPTLAAEVRLKSVIGIALRDSELLALVFLESGQGGVKTTNDTVLLRQTAVNSASVLLREGDELLASPIKKISVFNPAAGSPGHGRWPAAGALVARVTLADQREVLLQIALDGTKTPLLTTGAAWKSFGLPAMGGPGANIAFSGTMASGTGTTAKNSAALAFSDDGATFDIFAREDEPAPLPAGSSGPRYAGFSDPVINDQGDVFFATTLRGTGVKAANKTALFWGTPTAPQFLARLGGFAPDAAGLATTETWSAFLSLALPSGNQAGPVFTAKITGPGVTARNNLGLWGVDSAGGLRLLLRTGFPSALGAQNVKTFTLLNAVPGAYGVTRSYNATGSIAVVAVLADGTQSLLRLDLP